MRIERLLFHEEVLVFVSTILLLFVCNLYIVWLCLPVPCLCFFNNTNDLVNIFLLFEA